MAEQISKPKKYVFSLSGGKDSTEMILGLIEELNLRFDLEREWLFLGKPIRSKEFYCELNKRLENKRKEDNRGRH